MVFPRDGVFALFIFGAGTNHHKNGEPGNVKQAPEVRVMFAWSMRCGVENGDLTLIEKINPMQCSQHGV